MTTPTSLVDKVIGLAVRPADVTPAEFRTSVEQAVAIVTPMVAAYCRDKHVTKAGAYKAGIAEVIVTASARLAANPGQIALQITAGSMSVRKGAGFTGFTLGELAVLDRYRKRAI